MPRASRAASGLPPQSQRAIARLGRDLAVARRRRKLPQRLMAERMLVSVQTLQRLESGDARLECRSAGSDHSGYAGSGTTHRVLRQHARQAAANDYNGLSDTFWLVATGVRRITPPCASGVAEVQTMIWRLEEPA